MRSFRASIGGGNLFCETTCLAKLGHTGFFQRVVRAVPRKQSSLLANIAGWTMCERCVTRFLSPIAGWRASIADMAGGGSDRHPLQFRSSRGGMKPAVERDPVGVSLFDFRSRRGESLKSLTWDRDGFILWHNRLEAGVSKAPLCVCRESRCSPARYRPARELVRSTW